MTCIAQQPASPRRLCGTVTRGGSRVRYGRILITTIALLSLLRVQAAVAAITLPQASGETLSIAAPAARIITLAPNLAELVYAAGAGSHLVAVVEYSNFPPPVRTLTRVGNAFRFDLERILELKPDLVIAWQSGNPQAALQKLQQLGITVWQIEITQAQEIADAIENIAKSAGTEVRGRPAAQQLRARLEILQRQHAGKPPVNYFYQVAAQPLYTVNGQHLISHSLEICAGHNIFADLPTRAPQVSREAVISSDPQAMLAPTLRGQPGALQAWLAWPQLQAVRNHALLYLPADEISRATPRLLNSIELACKLLDQVRAANKHNRGNP